MAKSQPIIIPALGTDDAVEIIEILVTAGESVTADQALIVLENDKASMEIPAPFAGKLEALTVKQGDKVMEGDTIGAILTEEGATQSVESAEVTGGTGDTAEPETPAGYAGGAAAKRESETTQTTQTAPTPARPEEGQEQEEKKEKTIEVTIPDLGTDDAVEIIEVHLKKGDEVAAEDVLIVLESDKASMEIPAPHRGKILEVRCKKGDKVKSGDVFAMMRAAVVSAAASPVSSVSGASPQAGAVAPASPPPTTATPQRGTQPQMPAHFETPRVSSGGKFYAGPSVRKLAREFGVELARVAGSGIRGRILKGDVQAFVRNALKTGGTDDAALPAIPATDFSQFGEVKSEEMTRIQKLTAENMRRAWLNIPHVTQFEDADITELEVRRKSLAAEATKRGVKLTPVPILIKALAMGLMELPQFNVSVINNGSGKGNQIVHKKYCHVGMAVDTPNGLVVPVLRDADKKSIWELAEEAGELAKKARAKTLKREQMQGGCITLSSLGNLGGTQFTPIINPPEVAILGVSKSVWRPVWPDETEMPVRRFLLPLALSYDHRAVNGADGARLTSFLARILADPNHFADLKVRKS